MGDRLRVKRTDILPLWSVTGVFHFPVGSYTLLNCRNIDTDVKPFKFPEELTVPSDLITAQGRRVQTRGWRPSQYKVSRSGVRENEVSV